MKRYMTPMRRILALIGLVMAGQAVQSTEMALCFDTLFPETVAKELHDTVLQLWSDVTLLHDEGVVDCQKKDLAAMIAGHIVRISYLLKHMQTKNHVLNHDDLAYLKDILRCLSENFEDHFQQEHIKPLWFEVSESFALLCND